MAQYARTEIRFGKEDGEVVVIPENEPVDEKLFTQEQLAELVASKSIGPKLVTPATRDDEIETRDAEIAALKAKIAELTAPKPPAK